MNIVIPKELIKAIENTFLTAKTPKTVKTCPCRIKFNGQFITVSSGKTIWRNKGFAKSAFLHHMEHNLSIKTAIKQYILQTNIVKQSWGHIDYVSTSTYKQIRDELEKMGVIQYVESDIEDFAIQKK